MVHGTRHSPRRVVTDDGISLEVTDIGAGPAVLLIHAGSMSVQAWDRQIRILADSGHRVIAYDARGHGASEKPYGDYGIDRLAADALIVLDDAGAVEVSLVGWSLGGITALRLAATIPDRVAKLVLISTSGVSASRTAAFPFGSPRELIEPHVLAGLRGNRPAYLLQGLGELFGNEPDPDILGWLQRIALQVPSWAQLACMRTVLGTDQTHLLDEVRVPTVHIVGAHDSSLDVDGVRFVQERLGGDLIALDCGHFPMFELPEEFDTALLAELPGTDPAT